MLSRVTDHRNDLDPRRVERTPARRNLGMLALGLVPIAVACTVPTGPRPEPRARPEARDPNAPATKGGCRCVATDEETPCECPHCAAGSQGFADEKCRCGERAPR
jgi:hypothetical protein